MSMSQPVRTTLATFITVVGVLVLGLVAVAFGTSVLDGVGTDPGIALASTTPSGAGSATPPTAPAPAKPAAPAAHARHVKLVIDYGDGVQKHFVTIEHYAGMTVFDALLAARAHVRGIEIEHTGSGATALVRRIDDLKNQGAGASAGESRNWQYYVNDKYATAGAGATKIEPGDVVRWVFARYPAAK